MTAAVPLRVRHVAAWVRSIGGVETLLARHARQDQAAGWEATQVALFDRPPFGGEPAPGYVPLRCHGWTPVRVMRRAVAQVAAPTAGPAVTLWHNGWGLPWFAAADRSSRRLVCLWDSVEHFGPWLAGVRSWIDGVICMSEAAAADVAALLPGWPAERCQVLKVPLIVPDGLRVERAPRPEWVIGCAGRLVRPQKRWERLVPFVGELRRLGVPFRIEVVSDGPLRPWLQRRLGDDGRVAFLGWQSPADYWSRLQRWDLTVSFTDHEGGPITMLEGMAAGALPVYPDIGGSLVRDYLPQLDPRCQYAAGDPAAAARAVQAWTKAANAEVNAVRRRARRIALEHRPENYDAAFGEFVRRVERLPRVSVAPTGRIGWRWFDPLPLGVVTRLWPGALWQ